MTPHIPPPDGWQTCPGSGRPAHRDNHRRAFHCPECGWQPTTATYRFGYVLVPDHRTPKETG